MLSHKKSFPLFHCRVPWFNFGSFVKKHQPFPFTIVYTDLIQESTKCSDRKLLKFSLKQGVSLVEFIDQNTNHILNSKPQTYHSKIFINSFQNVTRFFKLNGKILEGMVYLSPDRKHFCKIRNPSLFLL